MTWSYSSFYISNIPAHVLSGFFSNANAIHSWKDGNRFLDNRNVRWTRWNWTGNVYVSACARAHSVIKTLRMEFHEAALKFAEPRKKEKEIYIYIYILIVCAGAFCCPHGSWIIIGKRHSWIWRLLFLLNWFRLLFFIFNYFLIIFDYYAFLITILISILTTCLILLLKILYFL